MNPMPDAGDVIVTDFPGATGIKRRPAVVLSSDVYHRQRPDVIIGIITSQIAAATAITDCRIQDWQIANRRVPSAFRAFVVTLPQSAVSAKIGRLTDRDWKAVSACIEAAMATSANDD